MDDGMIPDAQNTEDSAISAQSQDQPQQTSVAADIRESVTEEHKLEESLAEPTGVVDAGVPEDITGIELPREADARPDLQAADVASPQSTIHMSPLSELDEEGRNAMIMYESTTLKQAGEHLTASASVEQQDLKMKEAQEEVPTTNEDNTNEKDVMMESADSANTIDNVAPVNDVPKIGEDSTIVAAAEDEEGEEGEIDEDDEDDVVIRPRSRGKRSTLTQETELEESAPKRIKAEPAPQATVPAVSTSGVHINEEDDEEGNTKVTEHGELKGDRTYSSRAFRLPMRGETHYFLATEIARVSGYRDSYLLFNKNRNLKKLMTTEAEKAFLIQQELIPYSYRNRQIGVVNALSIYKTFGARVITRGMRVKDDYYAQRARDAGFTEADFANEEDRPVEDRLFAQAEAQRRAETDADVALASKAQSAGDFNAAINQQRKARNLLMREHFQRVVQLR